MNIEKINYLTGLISKTTEIKFAVYDYKSFSIRQSESERNQIVSELNESIKPVIDKYVSLYESELKKLINEVWNDSKWINKSFAKIRK